MQFKCVIDCAVVSVLGFAAIRSAVVCRLFRSRPYTQQTASLVQFCRAWLVQINHPSVLVLTDVDGGHTQQRKDKHIVDMRELAFKPTIIFLTA